MSWANPARFIVTMPGPPLGRPELCVHYELNAYELCHGQRYGERREVSMYWPLGLMGRPRGHGSNAYVRVVRLHKDRNC